MESDGLLPLVRRWWWLLVLGAVVGGAVAFAVADRLDPEYEAEVGLLTGPVNTDEGTIDAAGSLARTYSELATSGPLLSSAANAVGLTTSLADLRDAVTTSSNEISRIVTIRVRDSNPERASLFARVLADELIALSQNVTVETTEAVEEVMRQQEILLLPERRQAEVRDAVTRIFGTPLAGSLSVVDPPEIPEEPVAPQKRLIAALGALLGALAAATLAVFGEALRGRDRGRSELQVARVATPAEAVGPMLEMGPPIAGSRPGNGSTSRAGAPASAASADRADDDSDPSAARDAAMGRGRELPAVSSANDPAASESASDAGGKRPGQNGAFVGSEQGANGISAERVAAGLSPLGHVQTRQMFGWMGIFEDGMMSALVDSGLLFFRVDDSSRFEFEAAGSSQFGKMPYFEVPGDVADDPDRLVSWGRAALEAARRAKVGARKGRRSTREQMIRRSVGGSPIPAWLTLRRSLSVVGAATIGVIVAACGTSLGPADEGLGPLPPPAPQAVEAEGSMPALRLVDAVAKTSAARTARTLTLVSIERPGLPQVVTISANGRFDFVNHRGRFDVSYGGLISAFEPGAIRERSFLPSAVVVDGLTLYLNYPDVPDLFVDERIVVRLWVRTAVDEFTDELITDLGAAAQLGRSDPSQLLVWLRATGIEVDELGAEMIRGIETEHYRTTVDLTEAPEFAPATERDAYERQIDALVTRAIVTEVPLDVWVDWDNLVRRLASELTVRLGKDTRTSTVGWSVDLFDFGVDAGQGIPREARVMDYADLLQVAPRPPLRQSPVAQPPALEAFPSS